jgi:outer membrane lipase/esterase
MVVIGKRLVAAVVATVLTLAGCGGGDPEERYVATRVVVFGDELSFLEPDGRKHTINFANATTGVIDCFLHPLWVQAVAHAFGMSFPQCPGALPTNAEMRAAVGQKAADVAASVNTFRLSGSPKREDLVLIMVGMHDVLELFDRSPRPSEAEMIAELSARGNALAEQINLLATNPGGNPVVIVSTMPDLGLTPFALDAARAPGDAALLSRLSAALNSGMRENIVSDGRLVGLVFADAEIQNSVGSAAARGFSNVTAPACAVALLSCTTDPATLVAGATATSHLWADALRPGQRFHEFLGAQAVSRAFNNPF